MTSVVLVVDHSSSPHLVELTTVADQATFDSLRLGEHLALPVGCNGSHSTARTAAYKRAPHTSLSTTHLTVHCVALAACASVTPPNPTGICPLRHPLLTARMAQTRQEVSGGPFLGPPDIRGRPAGTADCLIAVRGEGKGHGPFHTYRSLYVQIAKRDRELVGPTAPRLEASRVGPISCAEGRPRRGKALALAVCHSRRDRRGTCSGLGEVRRQWPLMLSAVARLEG